MSQPNLNLLVDETDSIEKEDNSESSDISLRSNSNPNLIDSIDNSEESEPQKAGVCQVGGPRRKIPLIQVWEQKIQKEVQPKKWRTLSCSMISFHI